MKKHGTFEKSARQFGYDLEVEWKQFPTGQAVYEGLGPGHVHRRIRRMLLAWSPAET